MFLTAKPFNALESPNLFHVRQQRLCVVFPSLSDEHFFNLGTWMNAKDEDLAPAAPVKLITNSLLRLLICLNKQGSTHTKEMGSFLT